MSCTESPLKNLSSILSATKPVDRIVDDFSQFHANESSICDYLSRALESRKAFVRQYKERRLTPLLKNNKLVIERFEVFLNDLKIQKVDEVKTSTAGTVKTQFSALPASSPKPNYTSRLYQPAPSPVPVPKQEQPPALKSRSPV